jgi:alpha-1,6-mannosyltransferase
MRTTSSTLWLAAAGTLGAGAWIALRLAGSSLTGPAFPFYFLIMAAAWMSVALAVWKAPCARPRVLALAVWGGAVGFRLIGVGATPVFEDDWYRYLWDGRQFATTGNPYLLAPADIEITDALTPAFQDLLPRINNPEITTIYGPVVQAAFAVSYALAPAQLWPLQFLLSAVEIATLVLLGRLASPRAVLLFAWCPLLIQETAFAAHPDALWVAAVVAALFARQRNHGAVVAGCCGLAIAAKMFALIPVPFLLLGLKGRYWFATAAVTAACYLPFWAQGSLADLPALREMAGLWEFNSTMVWWLSAFLGDFMAAKTTGLLLFAAAWTVCFAWYWSRRNHPISPPLVAAISGLLGLFFLCGAVVNPWYLGALVPWITIRPRAWGIAALMTAPLSYAHGGNWNGPPLEPFELAAWVRPAEIGLIALGYLLDRTGFFPGDSTG